MQGLLLQNAGSVGLSSRIATKSRGILFAQNLNFKFYSAVEV
jgi:hypothetical protein